MGRKAPGISSLPKDENCSQHLRLTPRAARGRRLRPKFPDVQNEGAAREFPHTQSAQHPYPPPDRGTSPGTTPPRSSLPGAPRPGRGAARAGAGSGCRGKPGAAPGFPSRHAGPAAPAAFQAPAVAAASPGSGGAELAERPARSPRRSAAPGHGSPWCRCPRSAARRRQRARNFPGAAPSTAAGPGATAAPTRPERPAPPVPGEGPPPAPRGGSAHPSGALPPAPSPRPLLTLQAGARVHARPSRGPGARSLRGRRRGLPAPGADRKSVV